ncbi:hypothetical protein ACFL6S_11820, partial [Candidatus Poribacteria bacterium]
LRMLFVIASEAKQSQPQARKFIIFSETCLEKLYITIETSLLFGFCVRNFMFSRSLEIENRKSKI